MPHSDFFLCFQEIYTSQSPHSVQCILLINTYWHWFEYAQSNVCIQTPWLTPLLKKEGLDTKMFLQFSYQHIFQSENGGRPNVPDILILLTDGTQSKVQGAEDPATIAEEIRQSGIHMIVIGESTMKLILQFRSKYISVFSRGGGGG